MSTSTVQQSNIESDAGALRASMLRRVTRRIAAEGEMLVPCVPALLDQYTSQLLAIFAGAGRFFTPEETEHMKSVMHRILSEGFAISAHTKMRVRYRTDAPPSLGLSYNFNYEVSTTEAQYQTWVQTRKPPLFGAHPDARLMALLGSLPGDPREHAVLDVGAGTGRNTIAIAKAGHPTDAVEMSPALVVELRKAVETHQARVGIHEGDFLSPALELPIGRYSVVVLAEVVSHFRGVEQIEQLFARAARCLKPGGTLLFSTFMPRAGYAPDRLTRELSDIFWCTVFTPAEIAQACRAHPFELASDESVYEFEKAHLPPEAWPPTPWFAEWAQGQDLFDLPAAKVPIELRWLIYRKRAGYPGTRFNFS